MKGLESTARCILTTNAKALMAPIQLNGIPRNYNFTHNVIQTSIKLLFTYQTTSLNLISFA